MKTKVTVAGIAGGIVFSAPWGYPFESNPYPENGHMIENVRGGTTDTIRELRHEQRQTYDPASIEMSRSGGERIMQLLEADGDVIKTLHVEKSATGEWRAVEYSYSD